MTATAPLAALGSAEAGIVVQVATPADALPLATLAARLFATTYARADDGPVARGSVATSRPADVAAYADAHFSPAAQAAELRDPDLVTFVAAPTTRATPDRFTPPWVGYAQLRLRPSSDAPTPAACDGPSPRELARLYVEPAWQGRGVAAALLAAVRARAVAAPGGADPLWLAVYQANARAIAFYRRQGFAVVGDAVFEMGAEVQRDWLMTWRGRRRAE